MSSIGKFFRWTIFTILIVPSLAFVGMMFSAFTHTPEWKVAFFYAAYAAAMILAWRHGKKRIFDFLVWMAGAGCVVLGVVTAFLTVIFIGKAAG